MDVSVPRELIELAENARCLPGCGKHWACYTLQMLSVRPEVQPDINVEGVAVSSAIRTLKLLAGINWQKYPEHTSQSSSPGPFGDNSPVANEDGSVGSPDTARSMESDVLVGFICKPCGSLPNELFSGLSGRTLASRHWKKSSELWGLIPASQLVGQAHRLLMLCQGMRRSAMYVLAMRISDIVPTPAGPSLADFEILDIPLLNSSLGERHDHTRNTCVLLANPAYQQLPRRPISACRRRARSAHRQVRALHVRAHRCVLSHRGWSASFFRLRRS
jgi:hypothetical protein